MAIIQQVYKGDRIKADQINEIVNWCNDFGIEFGEGFADIITEIQEAIRKQTKRIEDILITYEKPDLRPIKARLTKLEQDVQMIVPQFGADLHLLCEQLHFTGKDWITVDSTEYSTGILQYRASAEITFNPNDTYNAVNDFEYKYPKEDEL